MSSVAIDYLGSTIVPWEPENTSNDPTVDYSCFLSGKSQETTLKVGDVNICLEIGETSVCVEYDHVCECASHSHIVVLVVYSCEKQETTCHVVKCKDQSEAENLVAEINERLRVMDRSEKVRRLQAVAVRGGEVSSGRDLASCHPSCKEAMEAFFPGQGSGDTFKQETRIGLVPDVKVEGNGVDASRLQCDFRTSPEESKKQLLTISECLPRSSSLNSIHSVASTNVSNQTVSEMYVQDGPPLEQSFEEAVASDQHGAHCLAVKYGKLIDAVRHRDLTAVTSLINETPELLSTSQFHQQLPEETSVSAVSIAVNSNALDLVKLLLERGADPNIGFVKPNSSLTDDSRQEHLPSLLLASTNLAMLKTLLRHNARTDVKDEMGKTALHLASELGSRECALALIEAGAQVTVVDSLHFTPLDYMTDLEIQQKKLIRESMGVFKQNKTRDPTASIRKRRRMNHIIDPLFSFSQAISESEEEKALRVLNQMCRNPECLPDILDEMINCIPGIILYSQLSWDSDLNKQIMQLMDSLLQACMGFEATSFNLIDDFTPSEEDSQRQKRYIQSQLMRCALEFLECSEEEMQGKALEIIDTLIEASKAVLRGPEITPEIEPVESNNLEDPINSSTEESRKTPLDLESLESSQAQGSMSRSTSFLESSGLSPQQPSGQASPTEGECKAGSPVEVLAGADPGPLLSILSGVLNQHSRCRNSKDAERYIRWQVYITRALAATSLYATMQKRLVKEVHIGSLLEPFDKANDPTVLHSAVSVLTALAENPFYHETLVRMQVPEKLSAFLKSVRVLIHEGYGLSHLRRRIVRLLVYLGVTDGDHLDGVYVFSHMVESETPTVRSELQDARSSFFRKQTLSGLRDASSPTRSPGAEDLAGVSGSTATLDVVVERLTTCLSDDTELTSFTDFFLSVYVVGVHPLVLLRLLRHRIFHHPVFPITTSSTRRTPHNAAQRPGSRCGVVLGSNPEVLKGFDHLPLPKPHKQALKVLMRWIQSYPWDLDGSPSVRQEIRLLLLQLQDAGSTYALCAELLNSLLVAQDGRLARRKSGIGVMSEKDIGEEYDKMKQQILSGSLPCTSSDVAKLAALSMIIDNLIVAGHEGGKERHLGAISEDACEAVQARTIKKESSSQLRQLGRKLSRLALSYRSSDGNPDYSPSKLRPYLPQGIAKDRSVREEVERHHKLFAAAFTADPEDAELRAMDQYIELCEQLPAYECQIFRLKQISKKRKATRVLGIGTDQIVILDGTEHTLIASHPITTLVIPHWIEKEDSNLIQLDFKFQETYTFSAQSRGVLKMLKTALVQAAREARSSAAEEAHQPGFSDAMSKARKLQNSSSLNGGKPSHVRLSPGCELSDLESMLGFPEEVARCLTVVEMSIYRKVPAAFYLRHVASTGGRKVMSWKHPTVQDLIERFGEVINWVSRVVTSATRTDERRAVISSLLRVALACKNMGNFMGATEILSGLRSQNLESTWPLLRTKDKEIFRTLSEMLITQLNLLCLMQSLRKTNELNGGRVIFYFGWLLKRIKAVASAAPSVVLNEEAMEDKSDSSHVAFERMINLDKLNVLRGILDEIQAYVDAMPHTLLEVPTSVVEDLPSLESLASSVPEEETIFPEEELRADFPLFPLHSTGLDLHILHQLHNGTTFIRYEDSSNPRTTVCVLKLMRCNSQLKWSKARWSSGKLERHESIYNPIDEGAHCIVPDTTSGGFDSGYVYLWQVREIHRGNLPKDDKTIIRRHGLSWLEPDCCLSLSYGSNVADTRYVHLIAPVNMVRLWYNALTNLRRAVHHHVFQADQRPLWLRKVYHKLYKENGRRQHPSVADGCREFTGGKWMGMSFSCDTKDSQDSMSPRSSRRQVAPFVRGLPLDGSTEKTTGQSTRKLHRKTESRRQTHSNPHEGLNVRELSKFEQIYPADNRVEFATFAAMYDRFWSCYRSDLRYLFDSKATVKAPVEKPVTKDAEQPQEQSTDGEQGGARKTSRRKTGTSLGPVVDALGRVVEDVEPSPDSTATEKKEVTASSLLSLGSVVNLALSSQRKAGSSDARSRWIAASQKKRLSKKPSSKVVVSNTSQTPAEQPEPQEIERPVMLMNVTDLQQFMKTEQNEELSESDCLEIITKYEKDRDILAMKCLSLEGWIRFMTSKENYAFEVEKLSVRLEEMTHPLSHYFIESSHNTYLTGHQLRGESTVEMYRQVLLTGCRCVELDCWDGEDGSPVIYHGHTLTTKIKFKDVVEAINEAAFVASPYPVILSFENHCSIPQQQEMARLCEETFKEKLVKTFLFEGDFQVDTKLPSPEQLKYRILIKNKKKPPEFSQPSMTANSTLEGQTIMELGEADDVDEDYDEVPDGEDVAARGHHRSGQGQAEDFIPVEGRRRESTSTEASETTMYSSMMSREATYKRQRETNKIAEELSRLVIYTQAVKFDRLPSGRDVPWSSLHSVPSLPCMLDDSIFRREGSVHSFGERSGTPFSIKNRSSSEVSLIGFSTRSFRKRGSTPGDIAFTSRRRAPSATSSHSSDSLSAAGQLAQQSIQGMFGGATVSSHLMDIVRFAEPPRAFQTSSLAENTAKKLCKKQTCEVVLHTEMQLMRVYPAARRFDSSNYNPMMFWPCGIQLIALNYQTEDMAMQLNRAFFAQNGSCGYVLKPYVMWTQDDSTECNKFNPWEIESATLPPLNLTITVVSGQLVSTNHGLSVYVEVEIIGVPADSVKYKTRQSPRNAFNPIWNEEFNYRVCFREIACVRFTVWDYNTQNLAQRVVPLRYLRRGYRQLRLRSPQDNVLEVASLFIRTQMNEETIGCDGWSVQKIYNDAWLAEADVDQGKETPEVESVEQQETTSGTLSDEEKMSAGEVTLCEPADRNQPSDVPTRTPSSSSMKVVLYNL